MFGQMGMPPWMQQGMGQGMGQQMTPGSGQPPYQNAPMNMQPPQMQPPHSIPGMPAPQQPPQSPINPAQMGMLSQMLAQNTRRPGPPMPPPGAGAVPGQQPQGAGAMPAGGMDPMQLGMLARMLGMGGAGGAMG
jgi:hypothetical protein